jgi:glycosyltransferase involved in cell wall biosynthesis
MVLFIHNRYRTTGGEERAVEELAWLVREKLDEDAEVLARDSSETTNAEALAGLLAGGLAPGDVGRAVRLSRARVVHAHNLLPTLGWRALAAARSAGARVVLHLHQYRLVCAIGICYTRGEDCTRCHGRNTLPGVRLNCRERVPESIAYAASLAAWQRRLVEQADAVIVPSRFARERLRELGAPLRWERVHVLAPPLRELDQPLDAAAVERLERVEAPAAPYALVASRLAPEKGIAVAIDACRMAGIDLVIAGDGPQAAALRERARAAPVRFVGRVGSDELAALRRGAAIAVSPSLSAETFGLAAAEAMAAGLPVAASRSGAHEELLDQDALVAPGDPRALAAAIRRLAGDREAGRRGRERVMELCAPDRVASRLASIYDGAAPATP